MTGTMVTVSGNDTEPSPPASGGSGRPGGVALAGIGLAVGLVLGILFTGGGTSEEEARGSEATTVDSPSADPEPTTTTTTRVPEQASRLATAVPGMIDTLITAAVDRNGFSVVTGWGPADRSPSIRALPHGDYVVDASFEWLAMSDPNRLIDQQTLWVGDETRMEPIASAVVGRPVWHTRRPGHLAWLEVRDGAPTIRTARFVVGQSAVSSGEVTVEVGAALVAWTDEGFLLVDPAGGELLLLGEGGELLRAVDASQFVAVGVDRIAYVDGAGQPLLADASLQAAIAAPWDGTCHRGEFSPLSTASVLLLCEAAGGVDRVEYWADISDTAPVTVEHPDLDDIAFTSGGLGVTAAVDSLRPATTLTFFVPTLEDPTVELSYPGRIQFLASLRG